MKGVTANGARVIFNPFRSTSLSPPAWFYVEKNRNWLTRNMFRLGTANGWNLYERPGAFPVYGPRRTVYDTLSGARDFAGNRYYFFSWPTAFPRALLSKLFDVRVCPYSYYLVYGRVTRTNGSTTITHFSRIRLCMTHSRKTSIVVWPRSRESDKGARVSFGPLVTFSVDLFWKLFI